jgi:hypothetical protein
MLAFWHYGYDGWLCMKLMLAYNAVQAGWLSTWLDMISILNGYSG